MPKKKEIEDVQLILNGESCKTTCTVLSILAKICEVVLVIGAICCGICGIVLGLGSNNIDINEAISAIAKEEGFPSEILEMPEVTNFLSLERGRQITTILGAVAVAAVLLIFASILARYVCRLFKNFAHGRTPFTVENVDLLQKIGGWTFVLVGTSIVSAIVIELMAGAKSVSFNISISTIAMGFVALVLAVVFRHGVELERKSKK